MYGFQHKRTSVSSASSARSAASGVGRLAIQLLPFRHLCGIKKGLGPHLGWGDEKDIANLTVLGFEAHGIDQHEAIDYMWAGGRHICGEPATDIMAHQVCPGEPHSVQKPQIKQRHVSDSGDPCQAWGISEAWMARGRDAKLLGQRLVMLQPARIGVATM